MATPKRSFSFLLAASGMITIILGFFYDAVFSGVPYQDPPPDLQRSYELHRNISTAMIYLGLALIAAGPMAWLISKARKQ